MLIILEGPDGSGKTTLATKISKQTGYPILHFAQPKTDEEKQGMFDEYYKLARKNYTKNVILDRCWYSEMVYGPIMRDKSYITYPQMYLLEQQLCKHGAMLIYCTAHMSTLWDRCQARGESYVLAWETFRSICKEFDNVINNVPHHIPVVTYEYKDM